MQLTKFDYRLANDIDEELQKLRCRVNYHALRFTQPIRDLGQKAVDQGVGLGILAQDAGLEYEDIGHGETPSGCRLNSLAVDGGHSKH